MNFLSVKTFSAVVIISLFSLVQTSSESPSNPLDFVQDLISHPNLEDCGLFLFQDREENDDAVSEILNKWGGNRPFFSVKYVFPTDHQLSELKLPKYISTALVSSSAFPVQFPITVSNYRKKGDECKIVILFLSDVRPQYVDMVYKMLTPVYIPIIRKDEDYFIFMTPIEKLDSLLLMRELPARVKYKLGVGYEGGNASNTNSLTVRTVCFFCLDGNPVVQEFPQASDPTFDYFPDFVINLNGRILNVAAPYIRARVEADPPWTEVNNAKRGVWKMLFEEFLTVKFNFTYRIFISTGKDGNIGGGGTGFQLPNGTWIGVTGDLVSGKADLGIVTANTPKRIHYIDFTESFFDFGFLTFVTSQGGRVFSPLALLWPFDLLMWFCIFLSTLMAFVFFTFIIKAIFWLGLGSTDSLNFARRGQISQNIWNFECQLMFVLTSFLDQDCVMPTFSPLRCFSAIYLYFTLVITTLYRSKLVTLLAFPIIEKLPTDFDQLAYSKYKVGFMKHGDSAYNTLAASTDPVYVKLVNEMEVINGVGLECLEKVVAEKYGCIAYDFALRHLKERNLSEADTRKLVFAPSHTYNIFLGIATEGRSIYKINFSKWLSLTRAWHFPDIWEPRDMFYTVRTLKRQWWFATNQSDKASLALPTGSEDDLTLKHISGAFYLHCGLLALCAIAYCWEIVKWKKESMKGNWKLLDKFHVFLDKIFVISKSEMDPYT